MKLRLVLPLIGVFVFLAQTTYSQELYYTGIYNFWSVYDANERTIELHWLEIIDAGWQCDPPPYACDFCDWPHTVTSLLGVYLTPDDDCEIDYCSTPPSSIEQKCNCALQNCIQMYTAKTHYCFSVPYDCCMKATTQVIHHNPQIIGLPPSGVISYECNSAIDLYFSRYPIIPEQSISHQDMREKTIVVLKKKLETLQCIDCAPTVTVSYDGSHYVDVELDRRIVSGSFIYFYNEPASAYSATHFLQSNETIDPRSSRVMKAYFKDLSCQVDVYNTVVELSELSQVQRGEEASIIVSVDPVGGPQYNLTMPKWKFTADNTTVTFSDPALVNVSPYQLHGSAWTGPIVTDGQASIDGIYFENWDGTSTNDISYDWGPAETSGLTRDIQVTPRSWTSQVKRNKVEEIEDDDESLPCPPTPGLDCEDPPEEPSAALLLDNIMKLSLKIPEPEEYQFVIESVESGPNKDLKYVKKQGESPFPVEFELEIPTYFADPDECAVFTYQLHDSYEDVYLSFSDWREHANNLFLNLNTGYLGDYKRALDEHPEVDPNVQIEKYIGQPETSTEDFDGQVRTKLTQVANQWIDQFNLDAPTGCESDIGKNIPWDDLELNVQWYNPVPDKLYGTTAIRNNKVGLVLYKVFENDPQTATVSVDATYVDTQGIEGDACLTDEEFVLNRAGYGRYVYESTSNPEAPQTFGDLCAPPALDQLDQHNFTAEHDTDNDELRVLASDDFTFTVDMDETAYNAYLPALNGSSPQELTFTITTSAELPMEIELRTTKWEGICMNSNDIPSGSDQYFDAIVDVSYPTNTWTEYQKIFVDPSYGDDEYGLQRVRTVSPQQGPLQFKLKVLDYGADFKIKVKATDTQGHEAQFRVPGTGNNLIAQAVFPKDIATYRSSSDDDRDAITKWEEYRGFVIDGSHRRFISAEELNLKQLFIKDEDNLLSQSGLGWDTFSELFSQILMNCQPVFVSNMPYLESPEGVKCLDVYGRYWYAEGGDNITITQLSYTDADPYYSVFSPNGSIVSVALVSLHNYDLQCTGHDDDDLLGKYCFADNTWIGPARTVFVSVFVNEIEQLVQGSGGDLEDELLQGVYRRTMMHEFGHSFGVDHHAPIDAGDNSCPMKNPAFGPIGLINGWQTYNQYYNSYSFWAFTNDFVCASELRMRPN